MPVVRTFTTILSDDEIEQISHLAKRLGCKEDEVEQRLLDLALDGLEDEENLAKAAEVPVDSDLLPRLSEMLEVAPAAPEPLLGDVRPEMPLLPGMLPGVPRELFRSIEAMPSWADPGKRLLRHMVSQRYLRAQAALAEPPKRGRPNSTLRATVTHHADGQLKRHPDEKIGGRVVWTLWGPKHGTDPELTPEKWDATLCMYIAGK